MQEVKKELEAFGGPRVEATGSQWRAQALEMDSSTTARHHD